MLRLYEGEVLGKLPVIQHFVFGCVFFFYSKNTHTHTRGGGRSLSLSPSQSHTHAHNTASPPVANSSFFPATWRPACPNTDPEAAHANPEDPYNRSAHTGMESTRAPWVWWLDWLVDSDVCHAIGACM